MNRMPSTNLLGKSLLVSIVVSLCFCAQGRAEKPAVARNIKVGYFNLTLVKASYPESVGSETLRVQAEEQLRREVEEANKRLQKASEEKKSQEELQKLANDIQLSLNAKRQALAQLIQTAATQANDKIFQTAALVAKENNLDLIVDGAGVYFGGQGLLESGQDVTKDVLKRLSPGFQLSTKAENETPDRKSAQQSPNQTQSRK